MYINKKRVSLLDTAGTYLAYALIDLMEKKPLEEISITELTKKAGVSRMSYYRSFNSKQHILEEHLQTRNPEYRSSYRDILPEPSVLPLLPHCSCQTVC